MKYISILFTINLFFITVGCGDSGSDTGVAEYKLNGKPYIATSQETLEHQGSSVLGTGALVFTVPLGDTASGKDFKLGFSLEEGGSLVLHTFTNSQFQNSIGLKFLRKSALLMMTVVSNSKTSEERELAGIDAAQKITVFADIHNDERPAHVLVWKSDTSEFEVETAAYNSEAHEDDVAGNGSDKFYGCRLDKATLSFAEVGEVKFEE